MKSPKHDQDRLPENATADRLWVSLIFLILLILVLRTSWISDDAYITFRSIENFINGYGLTYNIGERVQAYTHPLWMLILSVSYFISFRVLRLNIPAALPFLSLALSWLCFLFSIAMLAIGQKERKLAFGVGAWVLLASKAFMDFSASGLENPLTYAFLGFFFYFFYREISSGQGMRPRQFLQLSLIAGFATLNRFDTVLLFLPALAVVWYYTENRVKSLGVLIVGFSPVIFWELFSLFYYGFLFPNTAYAKLNSGISSWAYMKQGLWYLANSIALDPVSLPVVLAATLLGLIVWDRKSTPAAIGLLLYLGYILRIGGDYMSGRFLSAEVFLAVMLLINAGINWKHLSLPFAGAIVLLGIFSNSLPYASDSRYENLSIDSNSISDERGFRYQDWGLLRISRNRLLPDSPFTRGLWIYGGPQDVRISGAIGLEGYMLGPNVHILDVMALADPLLARLPAKDQQHWRIGHIERAIPKGYQETLATRQNMIEDPNLHSFYDYLALVTQGDLWDTERVKAIMNFQMGRYESYLDAWQGAN